MRLVYKILILAAILVAIYLLYKKYASKINELKEIATNKIESYKPLISSCEPYTKEQRDKDEQKIKDDCNKAVPVFLPSFQAKRIACALSNISKLKPVKSC